MVTVPMPPWPKVGGKGCVGTLSGVGGETAEEIGGIHRSLYIYIYKFTIHNIQIYT